MLSQLQSATIALQNMLDSMRSFAVNRCRVLCCRWRFPITCQGRPEFTEWMMKVLQGGVGDFPPSLRPLHERSVDLTFIGCVAHAAVSSCSCPGILKTHRSHLTCC